MGNLLDYYIVESVVDYDNDPLKIGRIKCTIPGVIHSDTTPEEGMPWIRCFRMGSYQTFSRPNKGQKVWVMVSKTNYNEFWYMPFHETIDITQDYIKEYYDENCDVLHARHSGNGDVMTTYDDEHGYNMKIGEDHINLTPKRQLEIDCNEKRIAIKGDYVLLGDKDDFICSVEKGHGKQPTIKGVNHQAFIKTLASNFQALLAACQENPQTFHLIDSIQRIFTTLEQCATEGVGGPNGPDQGGFDIYTEHTLVN
jgi:hypothetical protein